MTGERLIRIGDVVRDAFLFNPRYWSGELRVDDPNKLPSAAQRLFDLLAEREVPYALVGGVAMLKYAEGRNTKDVDIIIAIDSLNKLPELQIEAQQTDFARGKFEGLLVDLLFTRNRLFAHVLKNYTQPQRFVERDIPTATVEGMILLKLYALPSLYRRGDGDKIDVYETDVARLLRHHQIAPGPLLEILAKHLLATDVAELRRIVAEIEERERRLNQGGSRQAPPIG